VLHLSRAAYGALVGAAYDGFPLESCGLLVGTRTTARVTAVRYVPSPNLAASAKVYTIDPKVHLRADRDADDDGLEVIGVVHSHTHTDAYPSPTDVGQAPDPTWTYVIVSLRDDFPVVRAYRIVDGQITEEFVAVAG
jgi:[CysO sulfur-carrier protein]-S-L-cysteine hydrolase